MKIKVDIFSDAICPWCYVGKKRLEKAMAVLTPEHAFEVRWHPFQLNPQTPAEGVDRAAYLARKFGGPDRLREMDARMKEVGRGEGIEFNQEKILKTPNTLNAHRLIGWSARAGKQDAWSKTSSAPTSPKAATSATRPSWPAWPGRAV